MSILVEPHVDGTLLDEVLRGLRCPQKRLPCKLFYDETGARLFERICSLPEYYLTRAEHRILSEYGAAIAAWIGAEARIVEFGSGSAEKTRMLLRRLNTPIEYIPIDISREQLEEVAANLRREFPALRIQPLCADYTRLTRAPASLLHTVVFFPGSTIGNFEPHEAAQFLGNAAMLAGAGGRLLIGVDLRKDRATLERAYNDAAGITAAFNRNILAHVNRVCAANFEPSLFRHRAFYDEAHGRIEMHLVSEREHHVLLGISGQPARIELLRDETILTEYSYKYDIDGFYALARSAGLRPAHTWTDPDRLFSVHALEVM